MGVRGINASAELLLFGDYGDELVLRGCRQDLDRVPFNIDFSFFVRSKSAECNLGQVNVVSFTFRASVCDGGSDGV